MSDFSVTSSAELTQALAAAQSGDTIALAPGVYSDVSVSNLNFSAAVNVVSEDPANEAVLTDLSVFQSSGLHFQNLTFAGAASNPSMPFVITSSNHLELENITFQNQTSDDFSILMTSHSDQISLHNSNGQTIVVSPDFFNSNTVGFVANDAAPFPSLSAWIHVNNSSSVTLTDGAAGDYVQQSEITPAPAAHEADPPIVITGLGSAKLGDMVGVEG
jgi:hypothetical protein